MAVRIVTDSTCDITADLAEEHGLTLIAQSISFGAQSFKDNVTIAPDEFYSMLATSTDLPKTSQASPGEFREAYDRVGIDADGIVSIHISSKISGTCNSALQGAAQSSASCPIEVVDTLQASMGAGLVVLAAAEAAARGAAHSEIVATALDAVKRAQCICLFETLEYLRRGGRIGRAQTLLGSILSIKPMIIVRDGEVHPLGKARTFAKTLEQMKQTARGFAPVDSLAVMHSTTPDVAAEVADGLRDLLPEGTEPHITRFGPALGVHTGPGAIGIALLQAGT